MSARAPRFLQLLVAIELAAFLGLGARILREEEPRTVLPMGDIAEAPPPCTEPAVVRPADIHAIHGAVDAWFLRFRGENWMGEQSAGVLQNFYWQVLYRMDLERAGFLRDGAAAPEDVARRLQVQRRRLLTSAGTLLDPELAARYEMELFGTWNRAWNLVEARAPLSAERRAQLRALGEIPPPEQVLP